MNKDVTGITATDAAAPAIADVPPAPSDVVELTEHYETDGELAELALELVNSAMLPRLYPEGLDKSDVAEFRANTAMRQANLPSMLLISRALMRSAAAQERAAAISERSERRLLEARAIDEETRKLHLANLQLQNKAFSGEIERLTLLAQLAIGFATNVQAQALDNGAVPAEVIGEFVSSVRALSTEQAGLS